MKHDWQRNSSDRRGWILPGVVRASARVDLVVVVFLVVVAGGDAVLEDLVEVGLDIVGVGLLLVVFLVVVALGPPRSLGFFLVLLLGILDDRILVEVVVEIALEVVVDEVFVEVDVLVVRLLEVVVLDVEILVEFVCFFVSHGSPTDSVGRGGS